MGRRASSAIGIVLSLCSACAAPPRVAKPAAVSTTASPEFREARVERLLPATRTHIDAALSSSDVDRAFDAAFDRIAADPAVSSAAGAVFQHLGDDAGIEKAGGPIRAVIDLVGNAATTQLGFDCLTKGGKLVIVGLFGGGAPWALPLIPIKAITIQGSYVGNLRETTELLDLVRSKKIAPIPVTTMPLARANEALVDLQKGKLLGRAVLTP